MRESACELECRSIKRNLFLFVYMCHTMAGKNISIFYIFVHICIGGKKNESNCGNKRLYSSLQIECAMQQQQPPYFTSIVMHTSVDSICTNCTNIFLGFPCHALLLSLFVIVVLFQLWITATLYHIGKHIRQTCNSHTHTNII